MSRWCHRALRTLLLGVSLLGLAPPSDSADAIIEELHATGISAPEYDPFLQGVFRQYRTVLRDLGTLSDPRAKRVVVVDSPSFRKLEKLRSANLDYQTLHLNAVALSPGVILIDSDYADLLILSAMNRYAAFTAVGQHPNPKLAMEDPNQAEKFRYIVDDVIRGDIVRQYLNPKADIASRRSYVRGFLALHDYAKANREGDFFASVVGAALMPLILHEAAHLESRSAAFANPISLYADPISDASRREEDRADAQMIAQLTPLVSRLNNTIQQIRASGSKGPEQLEQFAIAYGASISLLSYALLHRDLVLAASFDMFRGYAFQDYFYTLIHPGCSLRDPHKIDPLEFKNVAAAWRDTLPTLTAEELEKLKAEVNVAEYHTHAHHFRRAANIIRLLSSEINGREEIDQFLSLIDHITFSKPLQTYMLGGRLHMNLRASDLIRSMPTKRVDKGVICPTAACYIAYPTVLDDTTLRTHLVIWADGQDRVLRIKYRTPLLLPVDLQTATHEAKVQYLAKIAEMVNLLEPLLAPHQLTVGKVADAIGITRAQRAKCGVGFHQLDLDDRYLMSRSTLSGDGLEVMIDGKLSD